MFKLFKYDPEYFIFKYFWLIIFIPEQKYVFLLIFMNLILFHIKFLKTKLILKMKFYCFIMVYIMFCFSSHKYVC